MNPGQAIVGGTLQPDGTLRLDEPPDLPPGRVVVTLRAVVEPADTRRPARSVQELIGIGSGASPPPDDETIRRWIDERRMEKYG